MIQFGRWFHRLFIVADAIPGGNNRGKFCDQPYCHSKGGFDALIRNIRIMMGQQRDTGLENIHGKRVLRSGF